MKMLTNTYVHLFPVARWLLCLLGTHKYAKPFPQMWGMLYLAVSVGRLWIIKCWCLRTYIQIWMLVVDKWSNADLSWKLLRMLELIVGWLLRTIKHASKSPITSMQCFAHHGLHQAYRHMLVCMPVDCMPNEAYDGQNVALKWLVICWCAWSSKVIILLSNADTYIQI